MCSEELLSGIATGNTFEYLGDLQDHKGLCRIFVSSCLCSSIGFVVVLTACLDLYISLYLETGTYFRTPYKYRGYRILIEVLPCLEEVVISDPDRFIIYQLAHADGD